MTHIKSKLFVRPRVLYWTVGMLTIADFFLSNYIPKEVRQTIETILTCVYFFLLIWATFYLFFKTFDETGVETLIEGLELEKEKVLKESDSFDNDEMLLMYKSVNKEFTASAPFIHLIKTKEEVTNISNLENYFMVLLIFFVSQFSFEYLKPAWSIIFIVLILTCILLCFRVLIWEGVERKNFFSPIIIGHVLIICMLFVWGKNSYIRSYGDEILGSYLEKFEYKTQYYVKVFPNTVDSKSYVLPADIHVYTESEEGETMEDRFGQEHTETYTTKYIILDKVFWPNGGYLVFDDCQLEMGNQVSCSDQEGIEWYIELTNEKVQ